MTGLSTYLRGLWVTYSVRMWLGWQTQCDVLCLCVSACINIRTRAAFASCFHGSDDTHSHISDCQEASVCIRANSVFTSNSIFTQCTLSFSYYYSRGFSYQFRCLWWRCYTGCAKLADQAQPSLSRMPCLREYFLIHTYSPKHLSLRLKSLNQHYVDLQGPRFSKRPEWQLRLS